MAFTISRTVPNLGIVDRNAHRQESDESMTFSGVGLYEGGSEECQCEKGSNPYSLQFIAEYMFICPYLKIA